MIQFFGFVPQENKHMNIEERNPTRKRIIESFFTLLVKKDYNDITVSRIMTRQNWGEEHFTDILNQKMML